jgi:stalled ribosome alternative rescue factor ArfA
VLGTVSYIYNTENTQIFHVLSPLQGQRAKKAKKGLGGFQRPIKGLVKFEGQQGSLKGLIRRQFFIIL